MISSSAKIKRQILKEVKDKPIRDKVTHRNDHDRDGEIIEKGNAFEQMIAGSGWKYVEEFLLEKMDLRGLALNDGAGEIQKGVARGYIALLKYVEMTMDARDKILDKERVKHGKETEDVL